MVRIGSDRAECGDVVKMSSWGGFVRLWLEGAKEKQKCREG